LTDSAATNNPQSTPLTSAAIKSLTLQAKDGIAISSDSDGVVRTWDISTGLCKASFQTSVKGKRDVRLIDGGLVAVWNNDEQDFWNQEKVEARKLYILHIEGGKLPQVVDLFGRVKDFKISGDGSQVFCLSGQLIQAWSIQTGESLGQVQLDGLLSPESLVVDGSRVWAYPLFSPPEGWDFGPPGSSPPILLLNTSPDRPRLDFISGTEKWDTSLPRIRDTVTGKVVFQLPERYARPSVTQWDGQYLVAGYESGEVLILDFSHMCLQ
jgi:WD40 repeat protein